jgi:predicted ATPase
MFFTVLHVGKRPRPSARNKAFLIRDNWNDWFEFRTLFDLVVFDTNGTRYEVGQVKIGEFGMAAGEDSSTPTNIPDAFNELDEQFFSLGQDENYYETLYKIGSPISDRIINGLRDAAVDRALFEKARHEPVMERSLLRHVREETVRRFGRLARGDAQLTAFHFSYKLSGKRTPASTRTLTFEVIPDSLPPTNIHVLIGRNGVGKTRCLNSMARCLVEGGSTAAEVGVFKSLDGDDPDIPFANLVSVSFSAFDPFGPLSASNKETRKTRYSYIGLGKDLNSSSEGRRQLEAKAARASSRRQRQTRDSMQPHEDPTLPKTVSEFTDEFAASVIKCRSIARIARWRRALEMLEADPLFKGEEVVDLSSNDDDSEIEEQAKKIYGKLSSGHKIVLLTLTRLVEYVDERTLVLLDEPEAHLHPPLLAAFVRSVSHLLMQRNGVAIIATHSPVVLQEAPKSCVWILHRSGMHVRADRPEIETFGENVGVLTREVFGLEVTHSGFHRILDDVIAEAGQSYEAVLKKFQHQLGAEARAIVQGLIATRDAALSEDED